MTDDPALAQFTQLRPRLFGVAYRMLASRSEADDVLQDAWLRWHAQDKSVLHSAEAWLVTVVTRLCIDRLRQLQQLLQRLRQLRPTPSRHCPRCSVT